ncbi:hypothetical protein PAMP_012120 [Pampus punctatissimus]
MEYNTARQREEDRFSRGAGKRRIRAQLQEQGIQPREVRLMRNKSSDYTSCNVLKCMIQSGESFLSMSVDALHHCRGKAVLKCRSPADTRLCWSFIHTFYGNIRHQQLSELHKVATQTTLMRLKVDNNAVACFKGQPFAQLTYLQWLSMAVNQLTELNDLAGPTLESLNLTGNSIQKLNGLQSGCFANLITLELRGNQLDTTDGINLPNLRRLYLAQNVIKRLEGLEKLERLTTLHLRDNQLDSLDGLSPNMKCLQYLNVRGNAVLDENALQCLRLVSKSLRALILSENPLVETTDYRMCVLILLPKLERIDKDPVSLEERTEAWDRIKERKEEEIPEP